MENHYDENLRNILPTNNGSNPIVLNRKFNEWSDHIINNLRFRDPKFFKYLLNDGYYWGKDRKLFKLCKEHAKKFEKSIPADIVLMITHPFYMSLSSMQEIQGPAVLEEYNAYLTKLMGFLQSYPDRSKLGIVICETAHHYAAVTSLLLEKGLVDKIIFTKYDDGEPLNQCDLLQFNKKDIYFGGAYNGALKCLGSTIESIKKRDLKSNLWGIIDLVIDPPYDTYTILPEEIYGIKPERTITLNQFIEKLDLKPADPITKFIINQ